MDKNDICWVLEEIDASNIRPYSKNVQCSCFLADWRKGHDPNSSHAGSMGISIDPDGESKVHCFTCHFAGTMVQALSELSGYDKVDRHELILKVAALEEMDVESVANSIPDYDEAVEEEEESIVDEGLIAGMMRKTHKYVLERVSLETVKFWEGGYDDKLHRAVFPVRRRNGDLVGAVGRTVIAHDVKYWNYFRFKKSQYLFGEDKIKGTSIVVVEGLFDTLAVWQALSEGKLLDKYSVVGLLGWEASPVQQRKLIEYAEEVISFHDNDPAGWSGTRFLAAKLQRKLIVKAVRYGNMEYKYDPSRLLSEGFDIAARIVQADLIVV